MRGDNGVPVSRVDAVDAEIAALEPYAELYDRRLERLADLQEKARRHDLLLHELPTLAAKAEALESLAKRVAQLREEAHDPDAVLDLAAPQDGAVPQPPASSTFLLEDPEAEVWALRAEAQRADALRAELEELRPKADAVEELAAEVRRQRAAARRRLALAIAAAGRGIAEHGGREALPAKLRALRDTVRGRRG